MPAVSKAQQRFFGVVKGIQKGDAKGTGKAKKAAKDMSKKDVDDFAKTKHKGLPNRVKKKERVKELIKKMVREIMSEINEATKRDYKAEYKKYGSSTKAKKYRAELNKYNRQKGTYGNGDGKDASHKGGKIVGFESQSKNRGRAEKSRLKKEMRESIQDRMKDIMVRLSKSLRLKSVVSMHTGTGSFSYFMDDEKEAKKLAQMLKKHLKRVRIINLDKSKGDTANFVVAADMFGLESVNESEQDKIKQFLMKKGDNEKDATEKLKYYDMVSKMYKGANSTKKAEIMSSLWANESVNEGVSKSQAQEIMNQLGGRKFEMLMGVKSKGIGKDGLILHIGKNPKRVSHIIIDLDRGRDLYNLTFGKIVKYQFKIVKKLKGIYVDQLHDMIEKYTGNLTTFRPRR